MLKLKSLDSDKLFSLLAYVTIGSLTAVIYFAVFGFMLSILHINYKVDVSVAYVLSTTFHFFANRQITFKAGDGNLTWQAVKYIFVIALNYIATLWIVSYCVETLGYSPYIGVLAAVAIITLINYVVFHYWVFSTSLKYMRG